MKVSFSNRDNVLGQIINCAGKEDLRPALTGVYVDPEGYLVAADGFALAIRKIKLEGDGLESFKGVILSPEFCKAKMLKSQAHQDIVIIDIDPLAIEPTTAKHLFDEQPYHVITGTFPNWRVLIPRIDDGPRAFAVVDPALALKLCKALDVKFLDLYHTHKSSPGIAITADGDMGVIMPMFCQALDIEWLKNARNHIMPAPAPKVDAIAV